MSEHVSPAIEKLAHSYVDGQQFTTTSEVLLFSLDLLSVFERHYQGQLDQDLAVGLEQLRRGEKTTLHGTGEVDTFFDNLMQSGRDRLP